MARKTKSAGPQADDDDETAPAQSPRDTLDSLLARARANRRQLKHQLDLIHGYLDQLPPHVLKAPGRPRPAGSPKPRRGT